MLVGNMGGALQVGAVQTHEGVSSFTVDHLERPIAKECVGPVKLQKLPVTRFSTNWMEPYSQKRQTSSMCGAIIAKIGACKSPKGTLDLLIAAFDHGKTLCGAMLARTAAVAAAMASLREFKNRWVDGDPIWAEMVFMNHP